MQKLLFMALLTIFCAAISASAFVPSDPHYPDIIKKRITEADTRLVCETTSPPASRRVGTILYKNSKKNWLVRVFTKDGVEMEAWYNSDMNKWFAEYRPSDIFYRQSDGMWIDANTLSSGERYEQDMRLKFTTDEMEFFKKCFKEKKKNG